MHLVDWHVTLSSILGHVRSHLIREFFFAILYFILVIIIIYFYKFEIIIHDYTKSRPYDVFWGHWPRMTKGDLFFARSLV